MQRFFVEPYQIDNDAHVIHITGADVNHIGNVLRMKKGEELFFISFTPRNRIMSSPAVYISSRDFQKQIRWN